MDSRGLVSNMNPLERQAIREIIHERDPNADGGSIQATE